MTNEEIATEEFIQAASGTCMGTDETINFINDYGNLRFAIDEDMLQWEAINNHIFLCPQCDWWCETGDCVEDTGDEESCSDCGVRTIPNKRSE